MPSTCRNFVKKNMEIMSDVALTDIVDYLKERNADILEDESTINKIDNPDDDEFPYDSAHALLRGSCNHFAVCLQKVLGYNPYIIEGKNHVSFHAFCQLYKNRTWYYVDARGITTSFDEFMTVAREFVSDEYTIRPATTEDIVEWEKGSKYNEVAYAFAEAVIRKYQMYYTL